jgi:hypothetical protein
MPLSTGTSKQARQENIKTEIAAGKDPKQAVAIGYAKQRENAAKKGHSKDKRVCRPRRRATSRRPAPKGPTLNRRYLRQDQASMNQKLRTLALKPHFLSYLGNYFLLIIKPSLKN